VGATPGGELTGQEDRASGVPADRLTDEALLAGLGSGDDELALAFVRRFQRRIYGVALAVLSDSHLAEDVTQQAFERAWLHADRYDPRKGSLFTWLATITRNLAIDMSRARRSLPVETTELLLRAGAATIDTATAALDLQSMAAVRSALRRLPEGQARAVVLAGIVGCSAREVAEREGIPLGTAKTRIRSGLHRLQAEMAELVQIDHG